MLQLVHTQSAEERGSEGNLISKQYKKNHTADDIPSSFHDILTPNTPIYSSDQKDWSMLLDDLNSPYKTPTDKTIGFTDFLKINPKNQNDSQVSNDDSTSTFLDYFYNQQKNSVSTNYKSSLKTSNK